LYIFCLTVLHL